MSEILKQPLFGTEGVRFRSKGSAQRYISNREGVVKASIVIHGKSRRDREESAQGDCNAVLRRDEKTEETPLRYGGEVEATLCAPTSPLIAS